MPSQSKQQQKFMGMVHALKKGDIKPSDVSQSVKDAAKSMSKKDAKDFASTKHKGLPRKVKQEILNKLKEYASKMGTNTLGGDDYTTSRKGGLRDFDGYDNVDYNKDMPMDENISPQVLKALNLGLKKINRKFKGASLDGKTIDIELHPGHNRDSEIYKIYDLLKKLKLDKYKTSIFNEGMFSTIDQIRQDSKDVRDFVRKVFADRDFKDMKNDKEFLKYLKSIYEGSRPNNWMQGRTSDYHTQLRGKKRDYDDTNFDKEDSGQIDLDELYKVAGRPVKLNKGKKKNGTDWTVTFKNGKTLPLSDVLALIKPFPKGIKKEYGSKLTLSYLPADEEDNINEIGIFPVQNYVKGIIPSNFIDTTTRDKKERLKSTLRDLKNTLNHFWKQHKIPYRIK